MEGVHFTKLKIYDTQKGPVYKGIQNGEVGLEQYGESYFSFINQDQIKGWKCHKIMTCNLICITGEVKIVLCKINDKNFHIIDSVEFILSRENYSRLTIPPGVWFGIKGRRKENIVLNVSDKVHDDDEVKSLNIQHPIFVKIKW